MTGEEMLAGRVPSELKQQVDADPRTNQRVLQDALRREFASDDVALLELRIENRKQELSNVRVERNHLDDSATSLREEIAALEEQLDAARSASKEYADGLDEILSDMAESGLRVFPGHARIDRLADAHDIPESDVIADLGERATRRELSIADDQFDGGGSQ